jgi:hypothetical protein
MIDRCAEGCDFFCKGMEKDKNEINWRGETK